MTRIFILAILSSILVPGVAQVHDTVNNTRNKTLQTRVVLKINEYNKPINPMLIIEKDKKIKINEIREVFNKSIKELKSNNEFQFIDKSQQIRVLVEQRDAMISEIRVRALKQKAGIL